MKNELEKEIEDVLRDKGVKNPEVNLSVSASKDFGDYSTGSVLGYAKELNTTPIELAEEIKNKLKIPPTYTISVTKPGYINQVFNSEFFAGLVKRITSDSDYGKNKNLSGQKIVVEYTDPNPFKEFHIGHLMPNVIGEALSRILSANGAEIKRANYQGDVGLHVAKAIWAMQKGISLKEAYAFGHVRYEEKFKEEIIGINKKIYDKSDSEINKLYETGKKESLESFEEMYKTLGTKFDFYFFESEVAGFGKEVVEKNDSGIFEKSDGAVVFKGENFDEKLHTRVFINKEGLPTYEAKELGLAKIKYNRYPYDISVVVTANEIQEYFKVLLKAMSFVFPNLAEKTKHISHGVLRLPEGKMSSRTGNIITAKALIDQVKEKIKKKMKDREMDSSQIDEVAEIIAIGAIKYSILRQAIGGDIIFDFDKSISFEGDSGPYLQYAVVRANSLLKKAEKEFLQGSSLLSLGNLEAELPSGWVTTNLERMIERFPSVVEKAGREYAPHYIVTYLIELAGEFNSFYAHHKIIDALDPTSPYRLAMTKAFSNIMTSGLNLLGIKVPEQM